MSACPINNFELEISGCVVKVFQLIDGGDSKVWVKTLCLNSLDVFWSNCNSDGLFEVFTIGGMTFDGIGMANGDYGATGTEILEAQEACKNAQMALVDIIVDPTNPVGSGSGGIGVIGCLYEGEGKERTVTHKVFLCKETEENPEPHLGLVSLLDGSIEQPWSGEFSDCENDRQIIFLNQWVENQDSEFCGEPIFQCVVNGVPVGKCFIFTGDESKTTLEIPVGVTTTPYQPSGDKQCKEAQIGPFELLPGATDVGTIVADALAANPINFDFGGPIVPVTADDIDDVKIIPKKCGTQNSAGDEINADFVNINGIAASYHHDDANGGIDATTEVEVPETGCSVVTLCFKNCLGKQEIAALEGEG